MTAAVIASETTKRIKTPPLPHVFYCLLLLPVGIITQFALRKWNHSESRTFRRADAPPTPTMWPCGDTLMKTQRERRTIESEVSVISPPVVLQG